MNKIKEKDQYCSLHDERFLTLSKKRNRCLKVWEHGQRRVDSKRAKDHLVFGRTEKKKKSTEDKHSFDGLFSDLTKLQCVFFALDDSA
jgi:hypothetical protein